MIPSLSDYADLFVYRWQFVRLRSHVLGGLPASSPLGGEDQGEGHQKGKDWTATLTLALSLAGRGKCCLQRRPQ
jgi:hypothetical protein